MIEKPIFVLLFIAFAAPLFGQSTKDPKPSEPVLKRAPSRSEWTVYFHQDREKAKAEMEKKGFVSVPKDAASQKTRPELLTVTKDGNIYREVMRKGSGEASEKWIVDGLQVYEVPKSGRIARSILPSIQYAENYSDYRRSDFEELEWVSPANYQGVKEVGGRKVFEFRVDASERSPTPRELSNLADPDVNESAEELQMKYENLNSSGAGYTAYFDIRSQRPLYFDDGQTVRIYSFSERPAGKLSVPSRFATELVTWQNELSRRGPLPPP